MCHRFLKCLMIVVVLMNAAGIAAEQAVPSTPYAVHGKGERAVVFIHGFMDAGNVWEMVMDSMRDREQILVTLDLPFMGSQHDAEGEASLSRLADAVVGVVDDLALPVVLVGQSMGTQIAELVARSRPEAIRGMILITPVPLSGLPVPEQFIASMRASAKNEIMLRQARTQMFPGLPPEAIDMLVRNAMQVSPDNISALIDAWSKGVSLGMEPGPADIPVLIIGGADDPMCTPEVLASSVAPRFFQQSTIILPHASHWPHIGHFGKVTEEIDKYLDSLHAW